MREPAFETFVGALVVAVAALFLWFALAQGGAGPAGGNTYDVTARFNNVSGLSRGSDVRLAGVRAGVVKAIDGDPERFEAVVTLALDRKWDLPDDTDARISTDGLPGSAYIALERGASLEMIAQDGSGTIDYTRGSGDLLTLFASLASAGSANDTPDVSAAADASDSSGGVE
jgi:phospholipid/cholesterol/gamma-HCH transport system substrate-binding protein